MHTFLVLDDGFAQTQFRLRILSETMKIFQNKKSFICLFVCLVCVNKKKKKENSQK